MIEITDRPNTDILLTAPIGPDTYPDFGFDYEEDTQSRPTHHPSLRIHERHRRRRRLLHRPRSLSLAANQLTALRGENARDEHGEMPRTLRFTWETEEYGQLLKNTINWLAGNRSRQQPHCWGGHCGPPLRLSQPGTSKVPICSPSQGELSRSD